MLMSCSFALIGSAAVLPAGVAYAGAVASGASSGTAAAIFACVCVVACCACLLNLKARDAADRRAYGG